jgi:hypothetical protein
MAGILSPSLLNLFVGKAFVTFQRALPTSIADAAPVHLGKLSDPLDYEPDVQIARYIDESQGIGMVVDATPIQYGGKGTITLKELTMYNLGLFLSGNPSYATITAPSLLMYGVQTAIQGALTITGTNGKGPRVQINITNALITPGGKWSAISKEYGSLTINFEHLADQTFGFGNVTQLPDVNTIAPTNWTPPFITSPTAGGSTPAGGVPAYAIHTGTPTTLACNIGQWTAGLGASVAFAWYRNASNANTGGTLISGATSQNYTVQSADATNYLYCQVTLTNPIGNTMVASSTTQAVV